MAQGDLDTAYEILSAYAIYLGISPKVLEEYSVLQKRSSFFKLYKDVHRKLATIMTQVQGAGLELEKRDVDVDIESMKVDIL